MSEIKTATEIRNMIALVEEPLWELIKIAREHNIEITEVAVEGVKLPFTIFGTKVVGIFAPND